MDVKKLARFSVPGHRVTGDRATKDLPQPRHRLRLPALRRRRPLAGSPTSSCIRARTPTTNARTLERALRFFAELGLDPPEAVMTDNALVYRRSRRFSELLAAPAAPPHPHARLHAALERQGRTLHPDAAERMGLQPQLAQLEHPRPLAC